MQLQARTQVQVARQVHEVFEAIVDPEKMQGYFITHGSGRLEEGRTVIWTWAHYNVSLPISVKKIVNDSFIAFNWSATGAETSVEISLEPIDEKTTLVKIKEDGWNKDDAGIASLAEQIQGWVFMVTWLKAYVEYGINLMTVVNRKFD